MLLGLKKARTQNAQNGGSYSNGSAGKSVVSKEKLTTDAKNRKKYLSRFLWYHSKIRSRQEAESKLKNVKGTVKEGVFLVRSSTACWGDFVLSFAKNDGNIVHFQIDFLPHNGTYSLNNRGNTAKELHFRGLDELIDYYHRESIDNACKLTEPCSDGEIPPPLSFSKAYKNQLHKAIESGKVDLALGIINSNDGPDVDDRDDKGNTALHLASGLGLTSVVEALLNKNASVQATDANGYTPLHLSCKNNHAACVHTLMVKGKANPQHRLYGAGNGNVALHLAAELGHAEVVKVLLDLDVPCHPCNFDKKKPMELAEKNGHDKCVKLLDDYLPPAASANRADWFHDNIKSREEACEILEDYASQDGYFLVRKSSKVPGNFVLDVVYHKSTEHYMITTFMEQYFIDSGPLLPSLEHLIEYYSMYADGLTCNTLTVAISQAGTLTNMAKHGGRVFEANTLPVHQEKDKPPTATEPMILDVNSIKKGQELGHGEYGSVLKGTWRSSEGVEVPVAIKTLHEQHMASGKDGFLSEAKVMVKLDHPCIVKLIGICQGPPLMLVQELLAMGSLLDYMLDYPEKVELKVDIPIWAEQVASGMMYLEQQGFVHRDLATRNILLAKKDVAKICDFGLSRAVGVSDYYQASKGGKWPVKWYAPESVLYGKFTSSSDVWSFGVTLWEMYSLGDQPYEDMNGSQVIAFLERKGRLTQPKKCPENMYDLMRRCWTFKENERPTFRQLHEELLPLVKSKGGRKSKKR